MGEEINWESVGKIVRGMRARQGLSYRELASLAGVGRNTILRLEAGMPSRLATVQRVEKALNLSDGVLTHVAPPVSARFLLQDRTQQFIHIRHNPNYRRRLPDYSQQLLQDPAERHRIGMLGLVSGFQWEADIGLENATLRQSFLELYHETGPNQHEGEELLIGLKGRSIVKIGDETFEVGENQTASLWPDEVHTYAPHSSTVPSQLMVVWVDSRKRH